MPAPETDRRYQAAVLFPATGVDRYGQPTMGSPREIRVDYDDSKRDVLNSQGQRIAVDGVALVIEHIDIGSELWLGELSDWLGTGSGSAMTTPIDVLVVKTYTETPDVKNRYKTREIGLMKKANTRNDMT